MFKIGDRVVMKGAHFLEGRTGTVVLLPDSTGDAAYIREGFGVEFDEPNFLLHNLRGKTEKNRGAWIMPEDLELIKSEKKKKEREMFKIGDKVRVIKKYFNAEKGDEGVVIAFPGDNGSSARDFCTCYAVDFGDGFNGHNCEGKLTTRTGHWLKPEHLELIKPKSEKIVITHDGKTTLARLYEDNKVVKSAEAKCDPRDEFSFTEGAKIAFERLTELSLEDNTPRFDKSMLTTGRFGCTSDGDWFVVVGDKLIYERGNFDYLSAMNDEGKYASGYKVRYVVEADSFGRAKYTAKVIWKAPDFDPKKVK